MPNLSALSRGTQLLAAAGVLLLLDTFLKWQSIDVGPFTVGQNAWNGVWGVVMGLLLIVLLAWVIARILDVKLPVEVPDGLVTVGLGALVFLFALLKNLTDDYSTVWSYIGVALAAGVAAGAWLRYQEGGGTMDTLRASMPARQSAGTSAPSGTSTTPEPNAQAPPAPTTPPTAPPATPPAAPAPEREAAPGPEPQHESETQPRPPDSPAGSAGQS